jgi:hypothetical protein
MRIHEAPCGETTTLEVRPEGAEDFGTQVARLAEAKLHFPEGMDQALLSVGGKPWSIQGVDTRGERLLAKLAERNLPRLCWVASTFPRTGDTRRLVLQVHEFPLAYTWPGDIDLGVDDKLVEAVRRKNPRLTSVQGVVAWLRDKVLLTSSTEGSARVFLSGGTQPQAERMSAFRLHGQGINVDVVREGDEKLRVMRAVEQQQPLRMDERRPVLLVEGRWRFCDMTVAGEFRGAARTQLDQLVERGGSYLQLWKDYNALERQNILRRAQAFGVLRYSRRELLGNGLWRFHLSAPENLEEKQRQLPDDEKVELEAAPTPPPELTGETAPEQQEGQEPPRARRRERNFPVTLVKLSAEKRTLDAQPRPEEEEKPPEQGALFINLSGDKKRLERREEAQALVASAQNPLPQLGLLIEGQPVPERRRRTEKVLTPAVLEVFGGQPTENQKKALEIALNTPDIALIQGPPGTGKTKVITALQVRLAELEEKDAIAGHTLLTSYQHDAVENAASRSMVFGLPAVNVSRRWGQSGSDWMDGFEPWRRERIEKVRAELSQLPEKPVTQVLREVRNRAAAYVGAPRQEGEAVPLLEEVVQLAREHLPLPLRDRMLTLLQELRRGPGALTLEQEDRARARAAVDRLRTEAVPFSDDGPRNARQALNRLESLRLLGAGDRELLDHVSGLDPEGPPPPEDLLARLRELKGRLQDQLPLDARPVGGPAVHADVEKLLTDIINALYERVRQSAAGPGAVLHDYLDDLEHDVRGVREAVLNYTAVLAATCQQAVGHEMSQVKGERGPFPNVIVDEAARANPLDLLIPLSLAERRIILVGDQRQLPHILEEDVESELERAAPQTRDILKVSLFQRLFDGMKALQDKDGIPRTVTLDVQFRMHPVLGDFVSKTFYQEGEQFRTTRPASDFAHGLKRYGQAAAAWVRMPLSHGREQGGRSKYRRAEASWIADEVVRLAKDRRDLSFGVIAFYKDQVKELFQQLARRGLAEQGDDNSYHIVSDWQLTTDHRERLRVGTVDAFQGKEFDVVLLSMTRSNDLRATDERAWRRKYGHLMLENRLCVGMSRQQRLLIVVGDEAMLSGEAASKAIPGLVAFRQLCEGSHGLVLSA